MEKHPLKTPVSTAIHVAQDEDGIRLDRWFKRHFPALVHAHLQKLLRSGQIRIDGKRAKASDRLGAGQTVRLPPAVAQGAFDDKAAKTHGARPVRDPERLRKWVIYEDQDVVVLNKPAGLAVQGGTGLKENLDDSLMVFSADGIHKPKLVHRLDRDTSGVLIFARNDFAAEKLTAAFRSRATKKTYWAITLGVPKLQSGAIDAPLVKRGEIMSVASAQSKDAKKALTLYKVVDSAPRRAAFVALRPVTGRTHQLRVHMASLGTPLLGDRLYGGDNADKLPVQEWGKGLHLHARRIVIPHPRKGMIDVTAPLPHNLEKTWKWFQFSVSAETDFDDE